MPSDGMEQLTELFEWSFSTMYIGREYSGVSVCLFECVFVFVCVCAYMCVRYREIEETSSFFHIGINT